MVLIRIVETITGTEVEGCNGEQESDGQQDDLECHGNLFLSQWVMLIMPMGLGIWSR